MQQNEWHYTRGEKKSGPVSATELRRLASAGELSPDDLIWREGMNEWTAARHVRGLFGGEHKTANPSATGVNGMPPVNSAAGASSIQAPPKDAGQVNKTPISYNLPFGSKHVFDMFLDLIRTRCPASFVESVGKIFSLCGAYGLYVTMGVYLLFVLLLGVKLNVFNVVLLGILMIVCLGVLQYVARRFCEALERLNSATSGNVSNSAFLDCIALFSMIFGVIVLAGSFVVALQSQAYSLILSGLLVFVVCEYIGLIAVNPNSIGIAVAPASRAGEEAIGIAYFFLKLLVQLTTVVFGAGVIYGTAMILYACLALFTKAGPLSAAGTATMGFWSAAGAAALPFVVYLLFLSFVLGIDICRAILVIPSKLDKLSNNEKQGD
jgi:hypothetical protein